MRHYFLLLFLFISFLAQSQNEFTSQILKVFPNAEVKELETKQHYKNEYLIKFDQYLDHENKALGKFRQRIFLSHYNFDAPMLMVTEGYDARPRHYELSEILMSNQVIVEYRFNGDSKPDNYNYKYLNNKQATKDLHYINKKLKKLYKQEWISTGISKGGTTCLMYKAAYPRDVKAAVPYVAPLPDKREDTRMDDLILSVGEKACRDKLYDFQKAVLSNRDSINVMAKKQAEENNMTFIRIEGVEKAVEYAVLEFTFSFWQLGHDCDKIPVNPNATEAFEKLMEIVGLDFYSDQVISYYEPSFYQFMTENGYYGFIHEPLDDYIKELKVFDNEIFGPRNVDLSYKPEYMLWVKKRLKKRIKKTIQIQGEYDPWAAAGFIPDPKCDALYMVNEKGSHMTRIKDLKPEQQKMIYNKLDKWLKAEIHPINKDNKT